MLLKVVGQSQAQFSTRIRCLGSILAILLDERDLLQVSELQELAQVLLPIRLRNGIILLLLPVLVDIKLVSPLPNLQVLDRFHDLRMQFSQILEPRIAKTVLEGR